MKISMDYGEYNLTTKYENNPGKNCFLLIVISFSNIINYIFFIKYIHFFCKFTQVVYHLCMNTTVLYVLKVEEYTYLFSKLL